MLIQKLYWLQVSCSKAGLNAIRPYYLNPSLGQIYFFNLPVLFLYFFNGGIRFHIFFASDSHSYTACNNITLNYLLTLFRQWSFSNAIYFVSVRFIRCTSRECSTLYHNPRNTWNCSNSSIIFSGTSICFIKMAS